MNIKQRLKEDMKQAMRNKEKDRLTTIRMVLDRIQKKEKETLRDATDDEMVQIVQTFTKQIEEEIEPFVTRGDAERVSELNKSLALVKDYLPQQMSATEVIDAVVGVIEGLKQDGEKVNQGSIMKRLMPIVKGKANNKMISQLVAKYLEAY